MAVFRYFSIFFVSLLVTTPSIADEIEPVSFVNACPLPDYAKIPDNNTQEDVITITSNKTFLEKNNQAVFSGGVTLLSKENKLTANELVIDQLTTKMSANGNINFQNDGINIYANTLAADQASSSTTLTSTSYQLADNPGHGDAGSIVISETGGLSLLDSSFTTCYGERPAWKIDADELNIDQEELIGTAYGARFSVYDIPVMYVPYFSYPLTDKRRSGFLVPSVGNSNTSGVEIKTPYYWNISENMDATFTPYLMSKRGVQLNTEFRYLSGLQSGVIDIEYLNKDRALKNNDDPRYLARFQHAGTASDNIRVYADYTTISDDNYLTDIGSSQYSSNDAYLYQVGEIAYFGEQWQTGLKLQDFEVLGGHTPSYKTLPQVDFNFYQPIANTNATFDVYTELSRFMSNNADISQANRYHVEAGVTLPYSAPAWFINSEFKLMQTNYKQIENNDYQGPAIKESISRTLPKVRLHGGINFDRKMYANPSYTQTLEPQLQYLYVPEVDQSDIGIYDTTQLQDNYDGLFRDRRYSGLDRIAQANQLSWGLTTRMLNSTNLEKFRFSFGQIVYFKNSNIADDESQIAASESALAADLFFQINRQWQFSSDIQYDTENHFTKKSQVNLDYRHSKNNMLQLNHRYTREVSGSKIDQVSMLATLELHRDWQFVGRVSQDIVSKSNLESYTGVQYENCCFAIQFAYHRHVNAYFETPGEIPENRDQYNSGFTIKFIMTGLSKGESVSSEEMLNSSIFGYKKPYFLNN